MEPNLKIVIIESDQKILRDLTNTISVYGSDIITTTSSDISIYEINTWQPGMAIIGPSLPADICSKLIQKLRIINHSIPILTSSRECLPEGMEFDQFNNIYYIKPNTDQATVSQLLNDVRAIIKSKKYKDVPLIIGQSNAIKAVRQKIKKIAEKDITVLITGETGTGKELVARSIHYYSQRSGKPLVKVDCTSLPDELLESEIFGFQKGAFTDAYRDKPGRLEMADGGTLFVDEIGDISGSLQVKFLQIFEEKEFSRLGATDGKIIDARVVAATNADLWKKVQDGSFRNDLFYRLNIMRINVPALRERREDIPFLVSYFHNRYCFEFKKAIDKIPEKVLALLMTYDWPGNIRELENVMRRAIAISDWNFIFDELDNSRVDRTHKTDTGESGNQDKKSFKDAALIKMFEEQDYALKKIRKVYVTEKEREVILKTLNMTRWNRAKASQLLGVSYKTLINRIQEFDIHKEYES